MIRTLLYHPTTGLIESDASAIATWQAQPETFIWVDLANEEPEADRKLLADTFDIHPLAIQDALRDRHPPKVEEFDNSLFVLLRGLDADTEGIDFGVIQLALFVGKRFFLTRHKKTSVSADWLRREIIAKPEIMAEGGGALLLRLTNRLIRRYLEILLSVEPRLDEIETVIFEDPHDELLAELTSYKSRFRHIARIASYHLQIAQTLSRRDSPFFTGDLKHHITDLHEQLERSVSLSRLYYEMASDLTDGFLAFASHRLNRVMQILTVFTVVFVPLTFMAGIYGMNFEYIPELRAKNGYFILVGLMLVLGIGQFIYFRKKKWV